VAHSGNVNIRYDSPQTSVHLTLTLHHALSSVVTE